jgi:ankyrin repeat protein
MRRDLILVTDNKGHTPVHCAVLNDHLVTLKYLIDEKGADFTGTDNEGPYSCVLWW